MWFLLGLPGDSLLLGEGFGFGDGDGEGEGEGVGDGDWKHVQLSSLYSNSQVEPLEQ